MNSTVRSIVAVLAGWATLEVLAGAVGMLLVLLNPLLGFASTTVDSIATMVVLPIAAYVGGFVAATISRRSQIAHAVAAGALAVAAQIALALWNASQGIEALSIPILIFTALWIIGFCGCGAVHARFRNTKRPARRRR